MAKSTAEMVTHYSRSFSSGWKESRQARIKNGGVGSPLTHASLEPTSKVKVALMLVVHTASVWKISLASSAPVYYLSSFRQRINAMSMAWCESASFWTIKRIQNQNWSKSCTLVWLLALQSVRCKRGILLCIQSSGKRLWAYHWTLMWTSRPQTSSCTSCSRICDNRL